MTNGLFQHIIVEESTSIQWVNEVIFLGKQEHLQGKCLCQFHLGTSAPDKKGEQG